MTVTMTRNVHARDPTPRNGNNSQRRRVLVEGLGDQGRGVAASGGNGGGASPSGSEAHQRQPSPGSVERQRMVSPSSTARQRQGSSHDRDTHDGSLTAVEELELTRRAQQRARETTLRRRQRLRQMQRNMEAAERAEKEAAVATTRAQEAVNRTGTGLRCSCDPTSPGARAGRQHGVAPTRGRRPLGRKRPVHSLFATRRVFR